MKKIRMFLMALALVSLPCFCFLSCHDEKEKEGTDSIDIIGTWVWIDDEGFSTNRTYFSETIIFNKDKTFKLLWVEDTGDFNRGSFSGEESGTWSYNSKDHTLTLTTIIGEKIGPCTYKIIIKGNQMTLIYEEDGEIIGPFTRQ